MCYMFFTMIGMNDEWFKYMKISHNIPVTFWVENPVYYLIKK